MEMLKTVCVNVLKKNLRLSTFSIYVEIKEHLENYLVKKEAKFLDLGHVPLLLSHSL